MRGVDGSPAVEIGEGYALAVSADKAWMLTERFTDAGTELWLYPIGAGQPRRLTTSRWTLAARAGFLADGKHVALVAREGAAPPRVYVVPLEGGEPKPISDVVTQVGALSPDGRWIPALTPAGAVLIPADGGAPVQIRGYKPDDALRGWTNDGRLYVGNRPGIGNGQPLTIDVLDPRTGARSRLREIPKPSIDGIRIVQVIMARDGATYAYNYSITSANLFLLHAGR